MLVFALIIFAFLFASCDETDIEAFINAHNVKEAWVQLDVGRYNYSGPARLLHADNDIILYQVEPSKEEVYSELSLIELDEENIYMNNDIAVIGIVSNVRETFIEIQVNGATQWRDQTLFDLTITNVIFTASEDYLHEGRTIQMATSVSSYNYSSSSAWIVEGNELLIFAVASGHLRPEPYYRERYCEYWVRDPYRLVFEDIGGYYFVNNYFFNSEYETANSYDSFLGVTASEYRRIVRAVNDAVPNLVTGVVGDSNRNEYVQAAGDAISGLSEIAITDAAKTVLVTHVLKYDADNRVHLWDAMSYIYLVEKDSFLDEINIRAIKTRNYAVENASRDNANDSTVQKSDE